MLLFFPNNSHHSNICRGPANCFKRHLTRSSWRKKEWVNALKWKMKVKYITFLEYSSCKIEKKGYLQSTNMHFFTLCWRDLVRLQTSGYSTWDWSEIRKTLWRYISGQSERIPICNWTFNVCIDWNETRRIGCSVSTESNHQWIVVLLSNEAEYVKFYTSDCKYQRLHAELNFFSWKTVTETYVRHRRSGCFLNI